MRSARVGFPAPTAARKAIALFIFFVAQVVTPLAYAEQSQSALSIVGLGKQGGFIASLDSQSKPDGTLASASATQSFTGLDADGASQTMTFSGTTVTQSSFGRLHCYTTASAQNTYFNASNSDYADLNANVVDTSGSPGYLVSLGFASFTDTLQYGGTLQAGYKARFLFHYEGTNSGTGALADLAVNVDANPGEAFFAGNLGFNTGIWATQSYDVNGITPQKLNVQFSNQVVFDLFSLAQGQDYSGTSDFSATLTLLGIEMLDAGDNPVPIDTWTVSSESGTEYQRVIPEPTSVLLLVAGAVCAWRKRAR